MALIKAQELKAKFLENYRGQFLNEARKYEVARIKAREILAEQTRAFSVLKKYDIFLSHAKLDELLILQLKKDLETYNLTVYVDWVEDPHLERSNVNKFTAATIRDRMRSCRSLLYAISENSKQSSWVQWELGFADGHKSGRVAIVPLEEDNPVKPNFYRQEYLGLYPYIDRTNATFWVNGVSHTELRQWLESENPYSIY